MPDGSDADIFGGAGVAGGAGGRGGGGAGLGGAIFARNANVTVRNSLFQDNKVIGGIGANAGSATVRSIFSLDSTFRIQNNQLNIVDTLALRNVSIVNNAFVPIIPVVTVSTAVAFTRSGDSIAFTFSLDEPAPSTGLTVNFQIGGKAVVAAGNPNADHSFSTGAITIPGGQRNFVLNGSILNDAIPELDETLTFQLLAGNGYQINPLPLTITIADDDLLKIRGTGGNDTLTGTAAVEQINGNAGGDVIDGNAGNDFIFGDAGDDRIIWDSGDGDNLIDGGEGTDTLVFNCSNRGDRRWVVCNGHRPVTSSLS